MALLPIHRFQKEILYLIERNAVVIVVGPTGSGKTTQIPQFLLKQGWNGIACTQPRRLAAISMATRVAQEVGAGPVGGVIGYSVRFEECTSTGTLCRYMTDGMLFRECLNDPLLSRYQVIMIDEAHERTLHTELLLALLKKIMVKRPELRLIISSATIDAEAFASFFRVKRRVFGPSRGPLEAESRDELAVASTVADSPRIDLVQNPPSREPVIISIEGSTFPVEVSYLKTFSGFVESEAVIVDAVCSLVEKVNEFEPAGDVLVFLSGRGEIEKCYARLSEASSANEVISGLRFFKKKRRPNEQPEDQRSGPLSPSIIFPLQLYAGMDLEEQQKALEAAPAGHRKVILSTNVAEASLTIEGIVYVIDSGRQKLKIFDPEFGVDRMVSVPISQASARQRAGRAGRTRPGKAFRLFSREHFETEMLKQSLSDLSLTQLTPILLHLKALGIGKLTKFEGLTALNPSRVSAALKELKLFGAIDDSGALTLQGKQMAQLPLEPAIARFLLTAASNGCAREGAALAAMLSVQSSAGDQSVFFNETRGNARAANLQRRLWMEEGDHLTLLTIFMSYLANASNSVKFCQKYQLNLKNLTKAHRLYNTLQAYLKKSFGMPLDRPRPMSPSDISIVIRKALISAFPGNIAKADELNSNYKHIDPKGPLSQQSLGIHPTSILFKRLPPLILYAQVQETTRCFLKQVSVIEPEWLEEVHPQIYEFKLKRSR